MKFWVELFALASRRCRAGWAKFVHTQTPGGFNRGGETGALPRRAIRECLLFVPKFDGAFFVALITFL